MKTRFYIMTILLFTGASILAQEKKTIEEIIDNPGPLVNETVLVEGTITQYIEETSESMAYYLLQGDFGGNIMVKTNDEPKINNRYSVIGTVYSEGGRPFIHENSRRCLDCNYYLLYIIIGSSVLLLIIIIYLIILSVRSKSKQITPDTDTNDYKTLIIPRGDPKTMQFIPGKLEILTGEDTGKSFMLPGYPTPEGSIVTLGKKKLTGDRANSHIQIDQKYLTVSRMQAELIYVNGKLFVRNLSTTNITQVDGRALDANEKVELKPGAVMKTGELEFKYVI